MPVHSISARQSLQLLTALPIGAVLPDLLDALDTSQSVVVQAPPGAGKTTRVPPALLDAPWCDGEVLVLEPRRVAARAVATRIAEERGCLVGEEIGYQVRHERRVSAETRLRVVTEGILTRRLQADPFLEGVSCVVLDEFHERSVHTELALGMLREVLDARDDLRVVVMSATLDVEPIAAFLSCPIVTSEGRAYPVERAWLAHTPAPRDLPAEVARVVRKVITGRGDDGGDMLVFLAGRSAIEATVRALDALAAEHRLEVLPLHGGLPLDEQLKALHVGERRRVILATNIAETSLTVPNVTVVIDTGRVKQVTASAVSGVDRLEERMVSLASAAQRAGRAGRVRSGRVFRLWSRAADQGLPAFDTPELHRVDITGAVLEVMAWSGGSPGAFGWFDPPPDSSIERAVRLLRRLGAVDEEGHVTELGHTLLSIPAHPRIARALIEGVRRGVQDEVAMACAILAEGDPFAPPRGEVSGVRSDLWSRVDRGGAHAGPVQSPGLARRVQQTRVQLVRLMRGFVPEEVAEDPEDAFLRALFVGFLDRVCLRRGESRDYIMVGGEPVTLARESQVRDADVVLALELGGARSVRDHAVAGITSRALIRKAAAIPESWLEPLATQEVRVRFDRDTRRVVAREVLLFEGLQLRERVVSVRDHAEPEAVARQLAEAASDDLAAAFRLSKEDTQTLDRLAFLRDAAPELELPDLRVRPDHHTPRDPASIDLIMQLCWGKRSFADLQQGPSLVQSLRGMLTREQWRALDEWAPARLEVPSGSHIRIQYTPGEPPVLAARIQELFGWAEGPRVVGGRVPVVLHLLAPNYRPAQVTTDLQSFWQNTYAEVRKELRARYPRHPWPEDPRSAKAVRK